MLLQGPPTIAPTAWPTLAPSTAPSGGKKGGKKSKPAGCQDDPGWLDSDGVGCITYTQCWGDYLDYANGDGIHAGQACCICGGGTTQGVLCAGQCMCVCTARGVHCMRACVPVVNAAMCVRACVRA